MIVSHFSGTGGPKQKPFELIEHGLWKLEDGISIGLVTKVDFIKGDRDEYPPLWQYMNRFKMIKLEADSFVQEPMEPIWLKGQNRWEDMEPDAEEFDPSEFESLEIPEPFEPELKKHQIRLVMTRIPRLLMGVPWKSRRNPLGMKPNSKAPFY